MTRQAERDAMIRDLTLRGDRPAINDPRVLKAMHEVPRHCFVPRSQDALAYTDRALPIGLGQTISQPYIVASMSELLRVESTHRVLEIGTGCGYQAAVLAALASEVFSVEFHAELAGTASQRLDALDVHNVHIRVGDGHQGWPEAAPFERILATCRDADIPPSLIDQLADGGRLLMPVGDGDEQTLTLLTREGTTLRRFQLYPVRFVPMLG
jgi:protein-L-isoaspartate(D-aspartate) O-methyltransferase